METKEEKRTWTTVRSEIQFYIDNLVRPGDDEDQESMTEALFRPLSAKLLLSLVDPLEKANSLVPDRIITKHGSVAMQWKNQLFRYVECGAWTEPGALSDVSDVNIDVSVRLDQYQCQMFEFNPSNEETTKKLVDVLLEYQSDLTNYVSPSETESVTQ